ncbi:hypothetical protein ACU4HD_12710 [Cupriavidus basilensis]
MVGQFSGWFIIIFKHTGATAFRSNDGMGVLTPEIVGVEAVTEGNKRDRPTPLGGDASANP